MVRYALTIVLAVATTVAAAPCSGAENNAAEGLFAANVSAACATSLNLTSATFNHVIYDLRPSSMCHSSCKDEFGEFAARLPTCDDVLNLVGLCANLSNPTMNGATCTTADFVFFDELVHTPMWANCSSVPEATLLSSVPEDYDSAMKLCASDNCTSFVNSLSHLWPKCAHDEENGELIPSFNEIFSCTPSPRDEPCAMVDIFKMKKLTETTPIWTNCSKYLGLAVDATFATIGPDRLEDAAVPSGYCVSPCPAYILYVLKHVMPPCTFQHPVVNPTPLYSLCPSTRPPSSAMGRALGSSTLTVMMAALLVY